MWSMAVRGMALQLAAPVVEEPMRTPSTRTMFWLLLAPRMYTLALVPAPPLRATSMPRWRCSRSMMEPAPDWAICAASMVTVSLMTSATGCGLRVAVTTTAATGSAWMEDAAGTATASVSDARAARREELDLMVSFCIGQPAYFPVGQIEQKR